MPLCEFISHGGIFYAFARSMLCLSWGSTCLVVAPIYFFPCKRYYDEKTSYYDVFSS